MSTTEKFLVVASRNGGEESILEVGAKVRLKTYADGIAAGLKMAGYTRLMGQGSNVYHYTRKGETTESGADEKVVIRVLSYGDWRKED